LKIEKLKIAKRSARFTAAGKEAGINRAPRLQFAIYDFQFSIFNFRVIDPRP
jgi:hypothetical protein